MEQVESLDRLSIASREHPHASSCWSKLTLPDNEVEEPTPKMYLSSPESTPIMTPETSDDEYEDSFDLPGAAYGSANKSEHLNNIPVTAVKELDGEGKDPLHTSASAVENSSKQSEDLQDYPKATSLDFEEDDSDPFSSPTAMLGSFEDAIEDFHDVLLGSELYYGVLISSIRKEDRETLERINSATAIESRSRTRIHRELNSLHGDETVPYLSIAPIDGNIGNCLACIEGAPETPYEGGIFWLHIDFPEEYPVKAPVVTFLTPVYHPNIDVHGRICIDILEEAWSPCLQTQTVLLSILSVLHSPIVDDDTLVPEIANKYLIDNNGYWDIVRVYTASATGSRPDTSNLVNLKLSFDSPQIPYQSTYWTTIDH